MQPDHPVAGGRLDFCTRTGGFSERWIPLDQRARDAAALFVETLRQCLAHGFFPAAPQSGACRHCDYLRVCGPAQEQRAARKDPSPLRNLARLRGEP